MNTIIIGVDSEKRMLSVCKVVRREEFLRCLNLRLEGFGIRLAHLLTEAVIEIEKATPEQFWIRSPTQRLPFGKLFVAIANKHARQHWVMLAREVDYDAHARYGHPTHCTEVAA